MKKRTPSAGEESPPPEKMKGVAHLNLEEFKIRVEKKEESKLHKIHDLGIPSTPLKLDMVATPSPISYVRVDKKKEQKPGRQTSESHLRSAFAEATAGYEGRLEEEKVTWGEDTEPLPPDIQSSLERSLPFLLEVKAGTYTIFQSAQRAYLPDTSRKKTLMLDLDNTLICAFYDQNINTAPKAKHQSKTYKFPYVTRPFLRTFLEEMDKHYELWVYTAGETDYAQDMLNSIDPTHKYFRGALTRDNCALLEMFDGAVMGMKNLSVVSNRKRENVVILDDTIHAWPNDLTNLLPIQAFHGDCQDISLRTIMKILIPLSKCPDVRLGLQERLPLVINAKKLMETTQS